MFLGLDVGAITPFTWTLRDRERIIDLFEMLCGSDYYIIMYGQEEFLMTCHQSSLRKAHEFLDYFLPQIDEYNQVLTSNKIFIERSADIGVLPLDVAINYGVSGPSLRGSGITFDLRKDEPYSVYDKFDFDVPVGEGLMGTVGDCWDRYYVKVLEMKESV